MERKEIQERSMSQYYQLFADNDNAGDHEEESVEEGDENNLHGSRGAIDQDYSNVIAEKTDASEEADATTSTDVGSPEAMRRRRCSRLTDIIPTKRHKSRYSYGSTQDERWTSASLATTSALSSVPMGNENESSNASHDNAAAPFIQEGPTNSQESSSESSLPDLIIEVEKKYSHDEPEEVYDKLEKTMKELYKKYLLKREEDTFAMGSVVQRNETEFHSDHNESFFETSIKEVERTASARPADTTGGSLIQRIIDERTVQSSPEANNLSKSLTPRTFSDVTDDDHDHSAEQRKGNNSLSEEEVQALSESFFERSIKEVERTASDRAADTTGRLLIQRIIDEWTVQSSPEANNMSKNLSPRTFSDVKGDDHDHSAEQRKGNNSLSEEEVQALSESFFERSTKEVERTVSDRAADTTGRLLIQSIRDEWTVQSSTEANNLSKSLAPRTLISDDHDHSAKQRKGNNSSSEEKVQALSESFFERSIKEVERTASDRAADTTGRLLIQRIIDEWTVQSSPEANNMSKSLSPRTFTDVKGDDQGHSAEQRKGNNSLSEEEVQALSESFFERSTKEVERTVSDRAADTTGRLLIQSIRDEWTVQSSTEANNLSKSLAPRTLISDVKGDDHNHSAKQRKGNHSSSEEKVQVLSESFFEPSIKEVERAASDRAADTTGRLLIQRIIDEWTVQSSPEANNLSKSLAPRTFSDVKGDDHDHSAEQRKGNNSLSEEEVQAFLERGEDISNDDVDDNHVDTQTGEESNNYGSDNQSSVYIVEQRADAEINDDDTDDANYHDDVGSPEEQVPVLSDTIEEISDENDADDHDEIKSGKGEDSNNNGLPEEEIRALLYTIEEVSEEDDADDHDDAKARQVEESNNGSHEKEKQCLADIIYDFDTDDADDHVYEREREGEKRNITELPEEDAQITLSRDAEINNDNEEEEGEDDDRVISYKVRDTNNAAEYNDAEEGEDEKSNRNGSPGEINQDNGDRIVENTDGGEAGEAASINGSTQDERLASDSFAMTTDASKEADATTSTDANTPEAMRRQRCSRRRRCSRLTDIIPIIRTTYRDSHDFTPPTPDSRTVPLECVDVTDPVEFTTDTEVVLFFPKILHHGDFLPLNKGLEDIPLSLIQGQDDIPFSPSEGQQDASKEADVTTSTDVNTPEAMRRQRCSRRRRCSRLTDIIPIIRTTYRDSHDFTPPTPDSRTLEPLESVDVTDPVEFTTDLGVLSFSPNKGLQDVSLSTKQGRDDVPFSPSEGQQALLSQLPEAEANVSPSTSRGSTEVAHCIPIESPANSHESSSELIPELITEVKKKYPHDEPKEIYDKLAKSMIKLYKKYILKIDEDTISLDSVMQRYETEYNSDDDERIESPTNSHESSNEFIPELNTEVEKKYPHHEPQEVYDKLAKSMTKLYKKYILKIDEDTFSMDSVVQRYETEFNSDDNESESYIEKSSENVERTVSDRSAKAADASKEADVTTSTDVNTPKAMRRQRCSRLTDIIPIIRTTYRDCHDLTPPTPVSRTVPLESADVTDPVEFTTDSGVVSFSPNKGLQDIPLSTKQGRDDVPFSPSEGQQALLSQVPEAEENVSPSTSRGSTEVAHCIPIESPANSHELITVVEKKYSHDEPKEVYDKLEKSMTKLYKKYILKTDHEDTISMDSVVQRYETEYNSDDDTQD